MTSASIIVPAYNCAATLPETVAALRAQSYDDFEIIIVDDGSTDETPLVARNIADSDRRIRIVHQENRGLAGARNCGLAAATGEFIGFCDADDLWEPAKLARHVEHLRARPHVGISFSGAALVDGAGAPLGLAQAPRLSNITAAHVFRRNPIGNGSAAVIRRGAARAIAWRPAGETAHDWVFDETFRQSEDIECWLRLALFSDWDIEGVPGALMRYRVNGGGLSANTQRQLESWERMVTKLTPFAPEFFERHAPAARAYQLRYLARRAVSARDGAEARRRSRAALSQSLRPLVEEPLKTMTTVVAAELLALAGGRLLDAVERRLGRGSTGQEA